MIEAPCRFRLAKEALFDNIKLGRVKLTIVEGLNGHPASDFRIQPQVHHTHGTAAQFPLHFVAAQNRFVHFLGWQYQAVGG